MRSSEGAFDGVGGVRLHLRAWEVARPRASILLVHGLGEHSGRFAALAAAMAEAGWSSYAVDLRGHGRSEGRRGFASSFGVLLQDVDRFRRQAAGLLDADVPCFLLGQSMGGLIALRYEQEFRPGFRGVVLVSPWLATVMPVSSWKTRIAPLLSRLLPALPFRTGLEAEHLSHDRTVVEAYRSDPLVHGTITPRLFLEVSAAMGQAFQRGERVSAPLLLLLGGDDPLVDMPRSVAFGRSLAAVDVTIRVFPGFFHEPLNEVGRGEVLRELRDWIAARLG